MRRKQVIDCVACFKHRPVSPSVTQVNVEMGCYVPTTFLHLSMVGWSAATDRTNLYLLKYTYSHHTPSHTYCSLLNKRNSKV